MAITPRLLFLAALVGMLAANAWAVDANTATEAELDGRQGARPQPDRPHPASP